MVLAFTELQALRRRGSDVPDSISSILGLGAEEQFAVFRSRDLLATALMTCFLYKIFQVHFSGQVLRIAFQGIAGCKPGREFPLRLSMRFVLVTGHPEPTPGESPLLSRTLTCNDTPQKVNCHRPLWLCLQEVSRRGRYSDNHHQARNPTTPMPILLPHIQTHLSKSLFRTYRHLESRTFLSR